MMAPRGESLQPKARPNGGGLVGRQVGVGAHQPLAVPALLLVRIARNHDVVVGVLAVEEGGMVRRVAPNAVADELVRVLAGQQLPLQHKAAPRCVKLQVQHLAPADIQPGHLDAAGGAPAVHAQRDRLAAALEQEVACGLLDGLQLGVARPHLHQHRVRLHQAQPARPVHVRQGDARRAAQAGGAVDVCRPAGARRGVRGRERGDPVRQVEAQAERVEVGHGAAHMCDVAALLAARLDVRDGKAKVLCVLVLLQAEDDPDVLLLHQPVHVGGRLRARPNDHVRQHVRPVNSILVPVLQAAAHTLLHRVAVGVRLGLLLLDFRRRRECLLRPLCRRRRALSPASTRCRKARRWRTTAARASRSERPQGRAHRPRCRPRERHRRARLGRKLGEGGRRGGGCALAALEQHHRVRSECATVDLGGRGADGFLASRQ
mmetsp:Transcript_45758/g.115674  ORF Transcript_45758/g.115674 Transcript_45758/m.115674 type:complete len:432 (-) Transcript_45758:392-1687(-)